MTAVLASIRIDALEGARAARAMRSLAAFHYRLGSPATVARVLVATCEERREDVGVLVVSNPALNAPWRAMAWPEAFGAPMSKRAFAEASNTLVRTIARVIVEPRMRGAGVARALVEAYLDAPLTPCTEALASMASWCPFFQAAGMREVATPMAPRHARLREDLRVLGLEAWRLIDVAAAREALRSRAGVEAALSRWLGSGRAGARLRRRTGVARSHLLALAASTCVARPVVLVTP